MTLTLPPELSRRFKHPEHLGDGFLGTTFQAEDAGEKGRLVALKVLDPRVGHCPVENLRRVNGHLERLRATACPGVAHIYQWDFAHAYWIAGELMGAPCLQVGKSLPLPVAVPLFLQMARALANLHQAGIVHGYMKPSNVFWDGGQVILTDSGLEPLVQTLAAGATRDLTDTYTFLSPEHFGIIPGGVDHRSDLYSLGVLAYALLSGKPPFEGETVAAILHQHAAREPSPLRDRVEVPPALEAIVLRLLRKEREERYSSTELLLQDLEEFHARVVSVPREPERGKLQAASDRLVGRQQQLESLRQAASRVGPHAGQVTLIVGTAGSGKSSLVEAVAGDPATAGLLFCFGKCEAFSDGRPFQSLSAAAGSLVRQWGQLPEAERVRLRGLLAGALGDTAAILQRVLPELTPLLPHPAAADVPTEFVQLSVRHALLMFLRAVATHWKPIMLALDDVHWASPATLELLAYLTERIEECPAWLVSTCRSEDAGAEPVQKLLHHLGSPLDCSPLTPDQVRRMLGRVYGERAANLDRLADLLCRRAGGNAFSIMEILRAFIAARGLVERPSGWIIDYERCAAMALPERLADLTLRRVHELDATARRWLALAGLTGSTCDVQLLSKVVAQPPEEVVRVLERAAQRQLVEPAHGQYKFLHDRIQEALVEELDAPSRRDGHRAVGLTLEEQPVVDPFALAHHFFESGDVERALRYSFAAASSARDGMAHATVITLCRRALQLLDQVPADRPGPTRGAILFLLGQALYGQGQYDEAVTVLEEQLKLVADVDQRVATMDLIARAQHDAGHLADTVKTMQMALEALGERIPSTPAEVGMQTVQLLAGLLVGPGFWGRSHLLGERRRIALRLYYIMSLTYFVLDYDRSLHSHLNAMRLAHGMDDCEEVVPAYGAHCVTVGNLGFHDTARRYGQMALEMAERVGSQKALASALFLYTAGMYCADDWKRTHELTPRTVAANKAAGEFWNVASCLNVCVLSYLELGWYQQARDMYDQRLQLGRDLGDPRWGHQQEVTQEVLGARLALLEGRLEDARFMARRAREIGEASSDQLYRMMGCNVVARVEIAMGNLEEAAALLEGNVREMQRGRIVHTLACDGPALFAEAAALQYEHTRDGRWLRTAERALFSGFAWARMHPSLLPALWRARARVAIAQGREDAARRALQKSLKEAERRGMRHQKGLTMLLQGRAERAWNVPLATATLLRAEQILDEAGDRPGRAQAREVMGRMDVPVMASSASPSTSESLILYAVRRQRVLDLSKQMATTLNLKELMPVILLCAVEATGAERALLVLRSELVTAAALEGPEMVLGGDPPQLCKVCAAHGEPATRPWSQVLLNRALSSGHGEVPGGAEGLGPLFPDLPQPPEVRSILVLPLTSGSQILGALYMDSGQMRTLGWPDEMLAAMAGQAALALQNAIHLLRVQEEQARRHAEELKVEAMRGRKDALAAFLGIASHDLKTPLTVIQMSASYIRPGSTDAALDRSRESIEYACRKAGGLIQAYLDAVQIEMGGHLAIQRKRFDLSHVISEEVSFQLMRLGSKRRDNRLEEHLDPIAVMGDVARIQQVVANLVGNALKFSPPDSMVHVRLSRQEGFAEFEVEDAGPGIPPEGQARLFQAFERLSDSAPGSGLGLWISRLLIEAHGGAIGVESEPGHGSRFWFRLPAGNPDGG